MADIKYKFVYNDILSKILEGKYLHNDILPTEKELCQIYNVSRITVSKAMNKLKEEKYILRIKKKGSVVQFLDSTPSESTNNIAILYSAIVDPSNSLRSSIEKHLKSNGYNPIFYDTQQSSSRERELLDKILHSNFCGLICYPCSEISNVEAFGNFIIKKIPIVFIDRRVLGINAPLISTDNRNSYKALVKKIISAKHFRIAYFGVTELLLMAERERFDGYCTALTEANIPIRESYVYLQPVKYKSSQRRSDIMYLHCKQALERFYANEYPPTAIACVNDICAFTMMLELEQNHKLIPEDISIVGFDNLLACETFGLTTMAQHFRLLGENAAQVMLDIFDNKIVNDVFCSADFIRRTSLKTL